MNKRLLYIVLPLIMLMPFLQAETILVAPVAVYDSGSNAVRLEKNPAEELYIRLSEYWLEGLASFRKVSAEKYGKLYTSLDASRLCSAEEAEYILFGYVQKNEGSWNACVKLYSFHQKKILKEFFASDSTDHYERLLDTLAANIVSGIEETAGLGLTKAAMDKVRPFEIRLPLSGFCWNYASGKWRETMEGSAGGSIGLHIYPPQTKLNIGKFTADFSLRPMASYYRADGKDRTYQPECNAFVFTLPLVFQLHFSKRNSVYIGSGVFYETAALKMTPKYEDKREMRQSLYGLESFIGYEFKAGRLASIFTEAGVGFHFNGDKVVTARAGLGLSFTLYRGKK